MTTRESNPHEQPNKDHEPPHAEATAVVCPFCQSTDTERFALFGSRLSTDHYTCHTCHTAFERIRHTAG